MGALDFPLLRSAPDWTHGSVPPGLEASQQDILWGMPALAYRWYFRAHSIKALERNILGFIGIAPIDETLVGSVEQLGEAGVSRWQAKLRRLGREAA